MCALPGRGQTHRRNALAPSGWAPSTAGCVGPLTLRSSRYLQRARPSRVGARSDGRRVSPSAHRASWPWALAAATAAAEDHTKTRRSVIPTLVGLGPGHGPGVLAHPVAAPDPGRLSGVALGDIVDGAELHGIGASQLVGIHVGLGGRGDEGHSRPGHGGDVAVGDELLSPTSRNRRGEGLGHLARNCFCRTM